MPTWIHSEAINVLRCSFPAEHSETMVNSLRPYQLGMGKAIDDFQSNLAPAPTNVLVNNNDSTSLLQQQFVNSMTTHKYKQILLHPRIKQMQDLDQAIISCARSSSAHWDCISLALTRNISDQQRIRLATVLFFSKSKLQSALKPGLPENWLRVLSNFHPCPLVIDGMCYPTLEHAFHAHKALCSSRPEIARMFAVAVEDNNDNDDADKNGGGNMSCTVGSDPRMAKKHGGRKGFRNLGAVLDVKQWNDRRISVTAKLLEAKWQQDSLFREVLASTDGMYLLHFERSGAKSFWGGSFSKTTGNIQGENYLGKMLMSLRQNKKEGSNFSFS